MMCNKKIKAVQTSALIAVFVCLYSVFTYASTQIKNFEYYINENNLVVLTGYVGTDSKVVVPSEIDGYKVYSTEETFYENDFIESVEFSGGIKEIGHHTFARCKNLKKVKIADTVSSLGRYAFSESAVEKIELPKSVRNIGMACFLGCADLTFVKANAKELDIAWYAFSGSGIKVLQIGDFSGLQLGYRAIPDDCTLTDSFVSSFIFMHEKLFSPVRAILSESYWTRFISFYLVSTLFTIVGITVIKVIELIVRQLNGKEVSKYNEYIRTSSKALMSLNNNDYSYLKYSNIKISKFKKGIKYAVVIEFAIGEIRAILSVLFPGYLNIQHKLNEKNVHFGGLFITLLVSITAMILAIILAITVLYLTLKVMFAMRSVILAKVPTLNAQIRKKKDSKGR